MIYNVNPQPKSSKLLPVGIGILLSVCLLAFGYLFIIKGGISSRAEDVAPRDVVLSEITENSAKVAWSTGQETQGVIEYGTSASNLNFFAPESEKAQDHRVDLTLLSPATTYYFQIRIADTKYDNNGVPWTFTTKSSTADGDDTAPTDTSNKSSSSAGFTTSPTCNETDCEKIKEKFFSGCDTQDYVKCIKHKEAGQ